VILLGLLLGAVGLLSRRSLEAEHGAEVSSSLLYLPKGPYLRALALGHEETLADLLYIWSIQYYSDYDDATRFEYLRQIYEGAITTLDPRFTEAYLVGAMIMSLEARDPDLALELLDRGLAAMPRNWEIAYWAGWESYNAGRFIDARRYWSRAASQPGAPAQLVRLAARMLERSGSLEDAATEYERILADPPDESTEQLVGLWLERTRTEIALRDGNRAIELFRRRAGRCPRSLDELRASGLAPTVNWQGGGARLRYSPGRCRVEAGQGIVVEGR